MTFSTKYVNEALRSQKDILQVQRAVHLSCRNRRHGRYEEAQKCEHFNTLAPYQNHKEVTFLLSRLSFELTNDHELKVFVECIEKAVVNRFRILRGDFAFDFLI